MSFADGPRGWSEEIEEGEKDIKRLECGAKVGGWHQRDPPLHYRLVTAAAGRVGFRRYHGGPPTILSEIMQSTQIFIKTESWLLLMFESSL